MFLAISELIYFRDTQPTYAPDTNASSAPLRCALTCSGVRMVATPFLHDSFIHYFTPVYPDAIQATGPPHFGRSPSATKNAEGTSDALRQKRELSWNLD